MKKYLGNGLIAETVEEGVMLVDTFELNISIIITPDAWKNLKEFMESNENSKSNA